MHISHKYKNTTFIHVYLYEFTYLSPHQLNTRIKTLDDQTKCVFFVRVLWISIQIKHLLYCCCSHCWAAVVRCFVCAFVVVIILFCFVFLSLILYLCIIDVALVIEKKLTFAHICVLLLFPSAFFNQFMFARIFSVSHFWKRTAFLEI